MNANTKLDLQIQLACAWFGPICILGYLIFWGILGHNIPPPTPGWSAEQLIANYFGPYHSDILAGMTGCAVVGILYVPWVSVLCVMMRRKEHESPVLANIQLLGRGITAWLLAMCPAMWALAAWYNTSNPMMTDMLWRMAWFIYMLTYMITTVEMVACGVYTLIDRSKNPIFPQWAGVVAIFCGLTFIVDSTVPYFGSGPFALNGFVDFYITFTCWLIWFAIYSYLMIAHLSRELRQAPGSAGQLAGRPA